MPSQIFWGIFGGWNDADVGLDTFCFGFRSSVSVFGCYDNDGSVVIVVAVS